MASCAACWSASCVFMARSSGRVICGWLRQPGGYERWEVAQLGDLHDLVRGVLVNLVGVHGTSFRQVPAWPDGGSMAVGDIGGIRGITGLVATGQSVPGGCGRCWVTKNAGPARAKKTGVRQMLAAIWSGAVRVRCRGRGRGGQERDQLAGDLPGGVAGQPVAGG